MMDNKLYSEKIKTNVFLGETKNFCFTYRYNNCINIGFFFALLVLLNSCFSYTPSYTTTARGTLTLYSNKVCVVIDESSFEDLSFANFFIGEFAMWLKSKGVDCRANNDEEGNFTYIVPSFYGQNYLQRNGVWSFKYYDISFEIYSPQKQFAKTLYLGNCQVEKQPGELRKVFDQNISIQRQTMGYQDYSHNSLSNVLAEDYGTIYYPPVRTQMATNTIIKSITLARGYTAVEITSNNHSANNTYYQWLNINRETYIKANFSDFKLTRVDGIEIAPQKTYYKHAGEDKTFTLYFPPIPLSATTMDLIEPGSSNWKFYGIQIRK